MKAATVNQLPARPRAMGTRLIQTGVLVLGLGGLLPGPLSAAAAGGSIAFVAAQAGVPLRGGFERFDAQLHLDTAHLDAAHLASASVSVRVEVGSLNAGGRDANELLAGPGFFDLAHFPEARFTAERFSALPSGTLRAHGSFTLKGKTVSLPVDFTLVDAAGRRWIEGTFVISRLAFGIGQGEWADTGTLEDAVRVEFRLPAG